MKTIISETAEELGHKAGSHAAALLRRAIEQKGGARLLMSTGASQFTTIDALLKEAVDWRRVELFHLDEYIGMADTHPASFRRYLRERFISHVNLKAAFLVDATGDLDALFVRLTAELERAPMDLGLIGIGENTHIAFNDPPADFDDPASFKVVRLDETCRAQQFGEGWFPALADVPTQAVSMTVSRIMKCERIISAVPYAVKARAVNETLTNDVTNNIPATILKTHPDFHLFIDFDSAALTDPAVFARYA